MRILFVIGLTRTSKKVGVTYRHRDFQTIKPFGPLPFVEALVPVVINHFEFVRVDEEEDEEGGLGQLERVRVRCAWIS